MHLGLFLNCLFCSTSQAVRALTLHCLIREALKFVLMSGKVFPIPTNIHACTRARTHTCAHTHACTHARTHTRMRAHIRTHAHVRTHTLTHACVHTALPSLLLSYDIVFLSRNMIHLSICLNLLLSALFFLAKALGYLFLPSLCSQKGRQTEGPSACLKNCDWKSMHCAPAALAPLFLALLS